VSLSKTVCKIFLCSTSSEKSQDVVTTSENTDSMATLLLFFCFSYNLAFLLGIRTPHFSGFWRTPYVIECESNTFLMLLLDWRHSTTWLCWFVCVVVWFLICCFRYAVILSINSFLLLPVTVSVCTWLCERSYLPVLSSLFQCAWTISFQPVLTTVALLVATSSGNSMSDYLHPVHHISFK